MWCVCWKHIKGNALLRKFVIEKKVNGNMYKSPFTCNVILIWQVMRWWLQSKKEN